MKYNKDENISELNINEWIGEWIRHKGKSMDMMILRTTT